MTGQLTTHVLDLTAGRPAAGMRIELWRRDAGPVLLRTAVTNADGRTDGPLLAPPERTDGAYELVFFVRAYFAARGVASPFLDEVPLRFTLAEAGAGCHVPLLVTPWGYSTYRGS